MASLKPCVDRERDGLPGAHTSLQVTGRRLLSLTAKRRSSVVGHPLGFASRVGKDLGKCHSAAVVLDQPNVVLTASRMGLLRQRWGLCD
jgi:hypothetical protein